MNISTPDVSIVDLARKRSGIVLGGSHAHAYRQANICTGVLVDVCVFPPRMLQSRSRREMANGGCESEVSEWPDRGVSGFAVSRVECGRRGVDRAKLKEFRDRLRRVC